tara:strand:- start:3267 stop:4433 length:1167 start_codon:yes stop_codon:yes gene_type:complete
MHLFELTENPKPKTATGGGAIPDANTLNAQFMNAIKEVENFFVTKFLPKKKKLDLKYGQQWNELTVREMENIHKTLVNLVQKLNGQTNNGDIKELLIPEYLLKWEQKKKAMLKKGKITPKSIRMNRTFRDLNIRYDNDPSGAGETGGEQMNKSIKIAQDWHNMLKDGFVKNINPIGGNPFGGFKNNPPRDKNQEPTPDPKGPKPGPGTDLSTDVKLKQLGYDDTVKGELIPGEKPDRTKLDKTGVIIDGEWTVVNNAMKQLPDLTPKQLVDMRPKEGDYIQWTGATDRSSRPGEANYGKVTGVRPNGVLQVISVNQQPNPSRQGRAFGLKPERVTKVLSKAKMTDFMPQQDPKKYRGGGDSNAGAKTSAVKGAIKKGMANVKKLRNFK